MDSGGGGGVHFTYLMEEWREGAYWSRGRLGR